MIHALLAKSCRLDLPTFSNFLGWKFSVESLFCVGLEPLYLFLWSEPLIQSITICLHIFQNKGGWLKNKDRFFVTSLNNDFENILVANLRPNVSSTCSPDWLCRLLNWPLLPVHSFRSFQSFTLMITGWIGDDSVRDWWHFKPGIVWRVVVEKCVAILVDIFPAYYFHSSH